MNFLLKTLINLILLKCVYLQSIKTNESSMFFKTNLTECTMFSGACKLSFYARKLITIDKIEFESENKNTFTIQSLSLCPSEIKLDLEALENADLSCLNTKSETKDFNIYVIEINPGVIGKAFLSAKYKEMEHQIEHQIVIKNAIRLVDR